MSLLDFGEDPPPSAPESDAAPAQAQGSDPFGDDPFGGDDLFGTGSGGGTTEDAFGEGAKSDDPFAGSGGDAFDPFSSPNAEQNKSPTTNSSAFDDFDPFSGPLLSPSAAPASSNDNSPQKEAFTFSSNDDPFGSADVSKPAAATDPTSSSDDPFGSDLLSGGVVGGTGSQDVAAAEDESGESKMAANGQQQQALEAQFDDLLGDMGGVNGEITRTTTTESTSEVSSSQGGKILRSKFKVPEWAAGLWQEGDQGAPGAVSTDGLPLPATTVTDGSSPGQGEREGSPGLSDTGKAKKDMKAMEYMKARYEVKQDSTQPKVARQPKKLEHTWGKEGEEETGEAREPPKKLPTEQDLLKYTSVGVDYTKLQYQDKASPSPSSPSGWNQSPKNIPPPVNRTVVEKVAPPEITKSVRALFEKGEFEDSHKPKKIVINLREAMDGGVYENNPEQMEGVTREADIAEDEQQAVLERGHTKNLLEKFTRASQDIPKARAPIRLDEDEGKVLENEPVQRDDVVRESDVLSEEPVLAKGSARNLRDRFSNYQEAPKAQKVIKLYEDDQAQEVIVENQPEAVRADVVRSNESEIQDHQIAEGSARNLKGFWSTRNEEQIVEKAPIKIDRESEGIVLENNPVQRDDVTRETDVSDTDKQIQIEAGRTHNMKNMWQVKYDEEADPDRYKKTPKKQPIKLDVAPEGLIVLENEPIVRDDVVRGDAVEEVVQVQRGHTRNMAGAFVPKEDEKRTGPREMIKIDRSEGPEVTENQPEEYAGDVVRGSLDTTIKVDPGKTKNMINQWLTKQDDEANAKPDRGDKPFWLKEMEAAKENAGVYENEPEVREDLLKEDLDPVEQRSIIPEKNAKSMKELWAAKMQEEEQKNKPLELVRFTPPREMTPPRLGQETQKSFQVFTFSQGEQQQQQPPNGYPEQNGVSNGAHPADEPQKSTATFQLKMS